MGAITFFISIIYFLLGYGAHTTFGKDVHDTTNKSILYTKINPTLHFKNIDKSLYFSDYIDVEFEEEFPNESFSNNFERNVFNNFVLFTTNWFEIFFPKVQTSLKNNVYKNKIFQKHSFSPLFITYRAIRI